MSVSVCARIGWAGGKSGEMHPHGATHPPPTPPLTGASTISRPVASAAAIRRWEAVGSMVLLSTRSVPFLACGIYSFACRIR